ncbi:MAG TPA: hypothetical protein VMU34_18615, partial [Mycobacterium sp.]|nr:hypothetical protein [Mycobacterium sp.]
MLINNGTTAAARGPSSQPPEHAATISATGTPNTGPAAARRTASHAAPIWATASAPARPPEPDDP